MVQLDNSCLSLLKFCTYVKLYLWQSPKLRSLKLKLPFLGWWWLLITIYLWGHLMGRFMSTRENSSPKWRSCKLTMPRYCVRWWVMESYTSQAPTLSWFRSIWPHCRSWGKWGVNRMIYLLSNVYRSKDWFHLESMLIYVSTTRRATKWSWECRANHTNHRCKSRSMVVRRRTRSYRSLRWIITATFSSWPRDRISTN